MEDKNICCGYNKPSQSGFSGAIFAYVNKDILKCKSIGKLFENNKWYCKRHAPSEIEKREEKKWQTYLKRINRDLDRNKI